MDPQRFDRLTKSLGQLRSRRSTLSAGGGFVGLTLAGRSVVPASAQQATPAPAGVAWPLQRFAYRASGLLYAREVKRGNSSPIGFGCNQCAPGCVY